MNEPVLTKSASTILKTLSSQYKKRLKAGLSKSDAADFGSSKAIHKELFPTWSFDDVDSACVELLNANLLDGFRADGYVYQTWLSDFGVAFSQGLWTKTASSFFGHLLELIQAIRSLLPW